MPKVRSTTELSIEVGAQLPITLQPNFKPPVNPPAQQPWRQKTTPLTAPMVNKNGEKIKTRTPYGGIYRPPAVRRLLDPRPNAKSEPQEDGACETQQLEAATLQPEIGAGDTVNTNMTQTQQPASIPPVLCSSERKSTRIKRPDQQVYVPRAKRLSTKDESLPVTERIDKSDSQPRTKVFISEKRSCVKVRKKSDNDLGVTENKSVSADLHENSVGDCAAEISPETPLIDLSAEISSTDPSFASLDSSVFETSQKLNESSEAFESSFQTCPEDSFSEAEKGCEENGPAIVIDLCDEESLSSIQQCDDPVEKLLDFSTSPSIEPTRSLQDNEEIDNMDESCESTDMKSSEISRLIVEDTDTPNSSLVSFSSDSGSLAAFSESVDSSSARVMGVLDISTESEDKDSPTRRIMRERASAKSPEAVADDWELLLNESGQFLDSSLLKELEEAVGKVSISRPSCDYKEFQTAEERTSDGECIIEIYGFSSELRTQDLMNIFAPLCGKNFQIAWVDDTHALGVFSSPLMADELLSTELPFVRTRPLSEGIPESRFKARKLVLPPMTRPKTCPALARRLVTGALGLRLPTSKLEREAERKVLKEARDKKRQEAKIRKDIWEGN